MTLVKSRTPRETYPMAGAEKDAAVHAIIANGTYWSLYRSARDAPPVAKIGLPKSPCRNRNPMNAGAEIGKARGIVTIMKAAKVVT